MKVQDVMTPCPHYIDSRASLDDALKKMKLQQVRHLPVVDNGSLVGVLSERDVLLSQFVCKTTNYCPNAGEVCVGEVYTVRGETDIAEVALEMSERKQDCAIVCDQSDNVIGIFTTTDACRLVHLVMQDNKSIKAGS